MRNIDLKRVIQVAGLSEKDIANQLFPTNKYPKKALDRILNGSAVLDADQISKLSSLSRIPIQKLYSGEGWKATSEDRIHVFETERYKAELDTETWITKIYDKGSLFHEDIIHSKSIGLDEYLNKLESIINEHENNRS